MKKFRILLAAAVFAAVCACTEKATETEERFSFSGPGEINAPFKEYTATVSSVPTVPGSWRCRLKLRTGFPSILQVAMLQARSA